MVELQKLLDNGWVITVMRNVRRTYSVYAARKGQGLKAVMPKIDFDNDGKIFEAEPGIPRQCGKGDTIEQAIENLTEKLFAKR